MTFPARIDLNDATTFPSRRVEEWKYTDLRKFLRETPPASPEGTIQPGGPFGSFGDELAFVNGRCDGFPGVIAEGEGDHVVRLRFVSSSAGTGHQTRCSVEVKDGASLILLETYEGWADNYVSNVALDVSLGDKSRLVRIILSDDTAGAISLVRADVRLGRKAEFVQTTLTSGAKLQRQETHVVHPGTAFVRIDGLYILGGSRHADLTSTVEHTGVDGVTSQLTKGVVKDEARGVFQGQIIVREGADGTDARMGHHALILSERGEVDAKPELEIYADDVACAHGNTVGSLDEDALFYARSRGLSEFDARAMLTEAFLAEVTDRIEREDLRDPCRCWLSEQMW